MLQIISLSFFFLLILSIFFLCYIEILKLYMIRFFNLKIILTLKSCDSTKFKKELKWSENRVLVAKMKEYCIAGQNTWITVTVML